MTKSLTLPTAHANHSLKLVLLGMAVWMLYLNIRISLQVIDVEPPVEVYREEPREVVATSRKNATAFAEAPEAAKAKKREIITKSVIQELKAKSKRKNPGAKKDADGINWSDFIFHRHGWDRDPVVIESHKLMFFTVPKNACTTFKKLFRRMMGYEDWLHTSPHNPSKNGLKYLGHFSKDQQREMMTSKDWTRAIFVRDPLERTLSAYMDKALQRGAPYWQPAVTGAHLKQLCCKLKGANATEKSRKAHQGIQIPACHTFPMVPYEQPLTGDNFSFQTFVQQMMRQCMDPHWLPQHMRMGQYSNWKFINFVGHFETKQADAHALLKRIGAFDDFGASGWGTARDETTNATRSLSIFETNTALHKTGSTGQMDRHYTKTVRKLVYQHYRRDYHLKVFNFSKPIFEVSGKEMKQNKTQLEALVQ